MLGNELEFRQYLKKTSGLILTTTELSQFRIERVVFNQLYEYLNSNNLLTESKSGFRPMLSTETTLLEATNEWLWNIE